MAVRELVENSFPHEEPILVREDDKIRVTSIGDFVESELGAGHGVCVDDRYYRHLKKSVEILTLDEEMRLAFRPLTAVFKHRSPEELWKITLQSGRTVTTTSSHNVFVLDENMSVVGKKTSDLRFGDRVVIPSSSTLETNLDEIEVAQELLKLPAKVTSRIVVHGLAAQYSPSPTKTQALLAVVGGSTVSWWELQKIAAKAGFDDPTKTIPDLRRKGYLERVGPATYTSSASRKPRPPLGVDRNWAKTDSVPLNFFRDNPPPTLSESALSFSVKQGMRRIPSRIPITRELMRVLGYFASEGSIHANYKISFSFGSHELDTNVKDLVTCLESVFHLKPIVTLEHKTAVNVVLNDASLAFLFERILGTGSRSSDKRVSWVVFGSSREMADEFLGAYIRGDGHVQSTKRNRKITLTTSSYSLFTDLKFLLVLSGKHFTTAVSEAEDRTVKGVPTRFAKSFYVYIRQGLAPESESVPIGNLREELRRIVRNKSNIYRLRVQKKWLRQNISGDRLPPALGKFVLSDAGSLPVKKIERVPSQSAWVYDVSVEGVERFIGGQAVALLHNSLDATELAGILPDVYVRIVADNPSAENANQEPKAYRITVADNGPGVDPHHVPRAFGKVFYGSKYVLRQSRGMFGMGGTMAILYGQITTNKPVKVTVSTDGKSRHIFEMLIDIAENKPIILRKDVEDGAGKTGTRVDVILEGDFTRAAQKINEYFKQTALVGSYANLTFVDPIGRITTFERATESMPQPPKETLPHPHGVDVEALKRMIKLTDEKTMVKFMGNKHFHRVGETNARKFLNFAGIDPKISPEKLSNEQIVKVVDALQRFPEFLPPDASCLSPVGEQILQTGIIKELQPEFSTVVVRPPSSYSGFPFLVEVGLAYGGKILEPGRKLFRFANRIPLLYDECYSEDTRVLTRTGFKLFSALSSEDELATLNPLSGTLEFQRPTRIVNYRHSGPMVHIKSGFVDLLVTPNHRMYCARRNKPYQFHTANDILRSFEERKKETADRAVAYGQAKQLLTGGSSYSQISLQLSLPYTTVRGWLNGSHKRLRFTQGPRPHFFVKRDADWVGQWDSEVFELPPASRVRGSHRSQRVKGIRMDLWMRFLGWYLAEGSAFRDKGGYVISLGFGDKDLRYKAEIDDSLRALGVRPRWKVKGEHSYEVRFSHKQLYAYVSRFGHAKEKSIPQDIKALPKTRLRILLDSLLKGDGTVTATKSKVFGTVASPRLASDVAEIAIKCGYAVTFGYSKEGMCVYLNVKNKSTMIKEVKSVPYDGRVWCATVPNHIMLVERAGKTVWSGNSNDVSFEVINEEIDWRRYHVPEDAPIGILTHICSTKVPYKTVGKEYIADRPEIESEIRNAVRETLRRLSLFLSKKGSMEAVQRKMSIYGRYLPMIARFSTELAGQKREPRYHQLIKEEEAEVEEIKEEMTEKSGSRDEEKGERPIEQTTIEDYR